MSHLREYIFTREAPTEVEIAKIDNVTHLKKNISGSNQLFFNFSVEARAVA